MEKCINFMEAPIFKGTIFTELATNLSYIALM